MRPHPTPSCTADSNPWRLTLALTAALALGAATVTIPAQAQAVAPAVTTGVSFGRADGSFTITVAGAQTNPINVRREGRDLLLHFTEAAPNFDAVELQARAAGWLDGVSVGHDAVLLRLSDGVEARADSASPGTLTLRFSRNAPRDERGASLDGAGAGGIFRLDLLRARASEQEGDLAGARERYTELRERMPRRVEPVLGLAGTEAQVGRWRRSSALYRDAQALAPTDPEPTRAALALERSQGGGARFEAERRRSRGGETSAAVTIDFAGIEASQRWSEPWKLGIDIHHASLDTSAVQRADGTIQANSSQRTRAAMFAQHDALDGTAHTVSLHAAGSTGGLGLTRRMVDDSGTTSVALEVHIAYWEQAEAIIEQAFRDRLSLARVQRLGSSLTGRAELGLNRYGLPDAPGVAQSTSLIGELRWGDLGLLSGLSAAYRLDAEYVGGLEQRSRPGGTVYAPLPLLDREVHSAALDYVSRAGAPLGPGHLSWSAQVGMGKDRYGRSGSFASAALTWKHAAAVAQLRGNQVRNIGRSRGTTEGLAASVSVPF